MAKRFTDTELWNQDWFIDLDKDYKLFWFYVKDTCDHAGIWKPETKIFSLIHGGNVDLKKALQLFNAGKDRIVILNNGRWYIPGFIPFQYGSKYSKSNIHKSVLGILEKNGVTLEPLSKGCPTLKDKDKDKDKDVKGNGITEAKRKEWFNTIWLRYPKERRHGKDVALSRFLKTAPDLEAAKRCARALENYIEKTDEERFILRASKWFAEWEDHADDDTRSGAGISGVVDDKRTDGEGPGSGVPASVTSTVSVLAANSRFTKVGTAGKKD